MTLPYFPDDDTVMMGQRLGRPSLADLYARQARNQRPGIMTGLGMMYSPPEAPLYSIPSGTVVMPTIPEAQPGVVPMAAPQGYPQVGQPGDTQQPGYSSQTMAQRIAPQADYAGRINAGINQFESASNAYQKNIGTLASRDATLTDKAAGIKAKRDTELADIAGERQKISDEAAQKLRSANAVEQSAQDIAAEDIDALYKDYKTSAQIDPERYMKNQSAGSMAASVIGMILGGIGSGLTGGPNYAIQIVDNKINNDIRAQIEKRNGLKDLIEEKRAQMGDSRAKQLGISNMVQLDVAQRSLSLAAAAEQTEKRAEGSLEGIAAGLTKNAALRNAEDKVIAVKENLAQIKTRGYAAEADIAASQQRGAAKAGTDEILPNQLVATGPVRPEMAKEVTRLMGSYNEIMNHLSTLEKLRADAGKTGRWTGQEKYDALQTSKALFNAQRRFTDSGSALSPMETALIEMKDPNKVSIGFIDDVLAELHAEKKVMRSSLEGQLRGNNVALRETQEKQQLTQGWKPQ